MGFLIVTVAGAFFLYSSNAGEGGTGIHLTQPSAEQIYQQIEDLYRFRRQAFLGEEERASWVDQRTVLEKIGDAESLSLAQNIRAKEQEAQLKIKSAELDQQTISVALAAQYRESEGDMSDFFVDKVEEAEDLRNRDKANHLSVLHILIKEAASKPEDEVDDFLEERLKTPASST